MQCSIFLVDRNIEWDTFWESTDKHHLVQLNDVTKSIQFKWDHGLFIERCYVILHRVALGGHQQPAGAVQCPTERDLHLRNHRRRYGVQNSIHHSARDFLELYDSPRGSQSALCGSVEIFEREWTSRNLSNIKSPPKNLLGSKYLVAILGYSHIICRTLIGSL